MICEVKTQRIYFTLFKGMMDKNTIQPLTKYKPTTKTLSKG